MYCVSESQNGSNYLYTLSSSRELSLKLLEDTLYRLPRPHAHYMRL